jgi:hypothetical protein
VRVELAAIVRLPGPAYRAKFGAQMRPSHRRAMPDIEQCRTEALGGQLYEGDSCRESHDRDHSCKTRHCPTCQHDQAEPWLANPQRVRLPVPHVLLTCTLPEALRAGARSHQKTLDHLLFRRSAEALQELAADPRCIGGRVGMVGGLHPWTRDLRDQPHGHDIVTGGGRATDNHWRPSRPECLVPVKPRSVLCRATFRDELHKTDLFSRVEAHVWHKDGGGPCEPVDRGQEAFRYLAPYIFRVAISHNRILKLAAGEVTFQDKASATDQVNTATLPAEECIRRFLQHVLPDRCINVRSDGLRSPSNRHRLTRARQWLGGSAVKPQTSGPGEAVNAPTTAPRCPRCGSTLLLVQTLRPTGR